MQLEFSEELRAKKRMVFAAFILFWSSLLMTHFPLYFTHCWPAFSPSDLLKDQLLWPLPIYSPTVSWVSVSMARTAPASWDWGCCASRGIWKEGRLEAWCTKATLSRYDQAVSNHRVGKAGKGLWITMCIHEHSTTTVFTIELSSSTTSRRFEHFQRWWCPFPWAACANALQLFPWRNFP